MKPTFRGSAAKAPRPNIGAAERPAAAVCKKLRRLIEFTFFSLCSAQSDGSETVKVLSKKHALVRNGIARRTHQLPLPARRGEGWGGGRGRLAGKSRL